MKDIHFIASIRSEVLSLLRLYLVCTMIIATLFFCSTQDDKTLRGRLREKQLAAHAAEECESLIQAGDFLEARERSAKIGERPIIGRPLCIMGRKNYRNYS